MPDSGHAIGQAFSRPAWPLADQVLTAVEGLMNAAGHLNLARPHFILTVKLLCEESIGPEDPIDIICHVRPSVVRPQKNCLGKRINSRGRCRLLGCLRGCDTLCKRDRFIFSRSRNVTDLRNAEVRTELRSRRLEVEAFFDHDRQRV